MLPRLRIILLILGFMMIIIGGFTALFSGVIWLADNVFAERGHYTITQGDKKIECVTVTRNTASVEYVLSDGTVGYVYGNFTIERKP